MLKGHQFKINCMEITNDNRFIISGSDDGTVRIWSFKEKKLKAILDDHRYSVRSAAITRNEKYIVYAISAKTVRVWRFINKKGAMVLQTRATPCNEKIYLNF